MKINVVFPDSLSLLVKYRRFSKALHVGFATTGFAASSIPNACRNIDSSDDRACERNAGYRLHTASSDRGPAYMLDVGYSLRSSAHIIETEYCENASAHRSSSAFHPL